MTWTSTIYFLCGVADGMALMYWIDAHLQLRRARRIAAALKAQEAQQ